MKRKWVIAVSLAAVISLSAATAASAADQVTQQLDGGTRSASNANLALSALTYSHSDQTNTGTLNLTADDSTGTGLGWNVTILSSDLAYSGTYAGTAIPASNFSITAAGSPAMTAGQAVDVVGGPKVPLVNSTGTLNLARKTIQANVAFGQGTYTQANSVSLVVPGLSKQGTYTATLTTTIAAAP